MFFLATITSLLTFAFSKGPYPPSGVRTHTPQACWVRAVMPFHTDCCCLRTSENEMPARPLTHFLSLAAVWRDERKKGLYGEQDANNVFRLRAKKGKGVFMTKMELKHSDLSINFHQ